METRANYFAVGVFVLACMVALVVAVLWLAGTQYREEFVLHQVFFPAPVTGLGPGTIVRFNGIQVGTVSDVNFDPDDPRLVIAILQVQPNVRPRTNSVASLETQGLTGVTFVQISGGTPDAPFLEMAPGQRYPVIPARPSTLQQLSDSLPLLIEQLTGLAENGRLLLNAGNRETFADILANLENLTMGLSARTGRIDGVLDQFDQISERLKQTLATADETAAKVGALATTTEGMVRDVPMADLRRLLSDTRGLITNLNRLTTEIERQPTGLLFGDRRPGYNPQ